MIPLQSRARAREDAGIILDWLAKLILFIGLGGVILVELLGILLARYHAAEGASTAVNQAAFAIRSGGVEGDPRAVAVEGAKRHGTELVSMTSNGESKTVSVTVRRKARTFFVHRFRSLQKWTSVTVTDEASFATGKDPAR